MNLTNKIGQLFLLGFHGPSLSPEHPIVKDIQDRNLGGVILFEKSLALSQDHNNILSHSQVQNLTSDLQNYAETSLLVAIDQEGGKVSRLSPKRGFPASPTAAELGVEKKTHLTHTEASRTAQLLKNLGINFNLAPVVDVNSYLENPIIGQVERSFSPDPHMVALHASTWIKAHRDQNILSCLKHFPGHGSSRQDSHLGFVDISDTWNEAELYPYKKLIEAHEVDAIMTGHLFNSKLDPDHPATLSKLILDQLLRKKLGYRGAIISDDMQMKAITNGYGLEESICQALAAGVDMIIIGNNLSYDENILTKAIHAVRNAVSNKRIPEERITNAHERVQDLKKLL